MPDAERGSPVGSIRSVERAFDLLEALERGPHPCRLSELSRATAMPKATVQRLLGVLERRGFVEKIQGRYQLGIGVVPLAHGYLAESGLTKASLPVLQELARESGETATLFVRYGFDRIVVQRVEGKDPLRYSMPIGKRLPLLLGAAGLVLAAAMPPEERTRLLDQSGEVRLGSGKILTRKALRDKLERVRAQGYAVSRDERVLGIFSLAAPVLRPDGSAVAAVAVTGPCARVPETKVAALSIEVRQAAQAIAEWYGGNARNG
jgi:DNA-binding IclR family transcriptional regulator